MNVKRIGFQLSGCYGSEAMEESSRPGGGFFENRQQSDLEHCAGCMYLIIGLSIFYPEMFTPLSNEEAARYGGERDVFKLLIRLLCDHELGELESGDIASDGTRDEKKKDESELEFVHTVYKRANSPLEYAGMIGTLFKDMQDKSTPTGNKGFLVDKGEAIDYNLFLETIGKTGWTNIKPNITQLDRSAYEITHDWRAADIWTCNMLITTPKLVLFEPTAIILEVIIAFAAYARKEKNPMPWLNPFIQKLEQQEITKLST